MIDALVNTNWWEKNFKAYLENLLKIPNCADSGLPKQDQT